MDGSNELQDFEKNLESVPDPWWRLEVTLLFQCSFFEVAM